MNLTDDEYDAIRAEHRRLLAEVDRLTREREGLKCQTLCDSDCEAGCHEEHQVGYKRTHGQWMHTDINDAVKRAEAAEAAISRVQALCDDVESSGQAFHFRTTTSVNATTGECTSESVRTIPIPEIRAAIRGDGQ